MLNCINTDAQNFKGGFVAGICASQIDGDHQSGYKKPGITIGLYTGRSIKRNLDWILEMRYTVKGAAQNFKLFDSIQSQRYEVRLNYIEFPLYLQYSYSTRSKFDLGMSFGYLLKSKIYDPDYQEFLDPENDFKPYDLTGLIGFGYAFTPKLWLNFRFAYSLLPVYKPAESIGYQQTLRNNSISISFVYRMQE
jgi:hypothetical protein